MFISLALVHINKLLLPYFGPFFIALPYWPHWLQCTGPLPSPLVIECLLCSTLTCHHCWNISTVIVTFLMNTLSSIAWCPSHFAILDYIWGHLHLKTFHKSFRIEDGWCNYMSWNVALIVMAFSWIAIYVRWLGCKYPKPLQGSCHGDVEKLWQEFFSDPSQWWDHRSEKVTRSIFLVILLLMQEFCEWLIVLGSGSLAGCEDWSVGFGHLVIGKCQVSRFQT